MSKKQPPYAPEYRRQAVELVPTGRAPGELPVFSMVDQRIVRSPTEGELR